MTAKSGILCGTSKSFSMSDMPLDGLRDAQNLQMMLYRSTDFAGAELGEYHSADFRHISMLS